MKRLVRIPTLALAMILCLSVFTVRAFAAEPQRMMLTAEVTLAGPKPSTAEDYTVVLEPLDSSNPMPAGSKDGSYKLTVTGAGKKAFPEIEFRTVGVYQYKICQAAGKAKNEKYDNTVYTVTVYVLNSETEEGALTVSVVLNSADSSEKQDEISFKNIFIDPDRPKTGDESNLMLWMSLMMISMAAVAFIILRDNKQKKRD